jgi:predicted PurR-regulated permease PerM
LADIARGLTSKISTGKLVDVLLPLLLVAALIAVCVQLLLPFVGFLLWTVILVICFYPLHLKLVSRGWSTRRSAIAIGTFVAAFILAPTIIAVTSAATAIPDLVATLQSDEGQISPPPPRLQELPVVGEQAHAVWNKAATDFPAFREEFGPQIVSVMRWLVGQAAGTLATVLLFVVAVVFAAIGLAYSESMREFIARIFTRLTGDVAHAKHYMTVIGATVRSVANGVIGVAFVQALLVGLGFFAVGMPGAGLLSLLAMVLGVLQIPVVLVTLPAIIWAFAVKSTAVAVIFTIWSVIAGLSDAALKPMMIGKGLEVPMPVILLGVIGGVMAYGLVGLFIGAVVLAVGYVLFREWLDAPVPGEAAGKATLAAAE